MVIYLDELKECFDKGLLKKTIKQTDMAIKDLNQARFFLSETQDLLDIDKKIVAALSLYNAFFHCARTLLFKDGIKERSHYCIARYIEQEYVKMKKIDVRFLNAFETIMSIRHNAQYSTESVEIEEDLAELYNLCEEFISVVEKFLI